MTNHPNGPLVALDVGNSRVKLGVFDQPLSLVGLPEPRESFSLSPDEAAAAIPSLLSENEWPLASWRLVSVNRPVVNRLLDAVWATPSCDPARVRLLSAEDLPLRIDVDEPERVGMDRLASAVAANRLRDPNRAAVVVDVGTAITVDLVSAEGSFQGGAVMPGLGTAAAALHSLTDLLPLIDPAGLKTPPPALGTNTRDAMNAGLFWGAIGGTRELIAQLAKPLTTKPHVFLTGGPAQMMFQSLRDVAEHVPHLTLAGAAISATG
ncbi:MAG: type III pantothenate kinase [Planctomycetales bacterium]